MGHYFQMSVPKYHNYAFLSMILTHIYERQDPAEGKETLKHICFLSQTNQ